MLSAENITYKVGNNILVNNVTVGFKPGVLNLIIGPNGAGKSTFIKLLCNLLQPTNGKVLYNGIDISTISIKEQARVRSVLSQSTDIAFPLTAFEVVMMGRYPHYNVTATQKDKDACTEAMQLFDVEELAERNYLSLSGGEKQRVHFARVIAQIWHAQENKYRYLFLDEPLTFLDVYYQYHFMSKVIELLKQKDLIVVGVVHDLNLAAKYGGYIALINHGHIIATGTPKEVFTTENIKNVYRLQPTIENVGDSIAITFDIK